MKYRKNDKISRMSKVSKGEKKKKKKRIRNLRLHVKKGLSLVEEEDGNIYLINL